MKILIALVVILCLFALALYIQPGAWAVAQKVVGF